MALTGMNDTVNNIIQRIVDRFHPEKIILFGSYAGGSPTVNSDLDLLIVMPVKGSRREKANEIDMALSDRLVPMDLIVVTPEQFEKQKNIIGTIVGEAVRNGRILFERAA